MESVSSMYEVAKLTTKNFHILKQKILPVLSYRELASFLTTKYEHLPEDNTDVQLLWCRNDRKAMGLISLSMSYEHLRNVDGFTSASSMRRALFHIFERHTILNKMTTRRKFYPAILSEKETNLGFTDPVRILGATLPTMAVVVGESELGMATLNGIP